MNAARQPSPAIVPQEAARALPLWALLALCAVYIVAGFVGREPWKGADIISYAATLSLLDAHGWRQWLQPHTYRREHSFVLVVNFVDFHSLHPVAQCVRMRTVYSVFCINPVSKYGLEVAGTVTKLPPLDLYWISKFVEPLPKV